MSIAALADLVSIGDVAVLTGAGMSTESGIPDYRGATGAQRRTKPMTHQEFVRDPVARRRYWARSHLGWRAMADARPNEGHLGLARLEAAGVITGTITQNVDGLHQAAGSRRVVDLHGRLDRVVCLACGETTPRTQLDARLHEANRDWRATVLAHHADGDTELDPRAIEDFRVVDCSACDGPLKPDVVYFGDNVPPERVDEALSLIDRARALLVLGTSLHVYSGRRFVLRAEQRGLPIAIVNQGPTRCDALATVRIDAPIGRSIIELQSVARWTDRATMLERT